MASHHPDEMPLFAFMKNEYNNRLSKFNKLGQSFELVLIWAVFVPCFPLVPVQVKRYSLVRK